MFPSTINNPLDLNYEFEQKTHCHHFVSWFTLEWAASLVEIIGELRRRDRLKYRVQKYLRATFHSS